MVRPALFAALLLSLAAPAATQERELTADVRMHKIASKHLPVPRDLVICLPPGYETDTSRRYPVLYMHDGSNAGGADRTRTARRPRNFKFGFTEQPPILDDN